MSINRYFHLILTSYELNVDLSIFIQLCTATNLGEAIILKSGLFQVTPLKIVFHHRPTYELLIWKFVSPKYEHFLTTQSTKKRGSTWNFFNHSHRFSEQVCSQGSDVALCPTELEAFVRQL